MLNRLNPRVAVKASLQHGKRNIKYKETHGNMKRAYGEVKYMCGKGN